MAISQYELMIEPYLEEITTLIAAGHTEGHIAKYYGIHPLTLTSYKKKHPLLKQAILDGKRKILPAIVDGLIRRAKGYEVEERTVDVTQDPASRRVLRQRTKITKRHIPPDVAAAKLWLEKRHPEQWGDGSTLTSDQKIQIIKTIYKQRDEKSWTATKTARELEKFGVSLPESLKIELRHELETIGGENLPTPILEILYEDESREELGN